MQLDGWIISLTAKALAESMDVHTMSHVARKLIHNYDIYKRTGFPLNFPIPKKDAARQIMNDMRDKELFFQLINLLIDIHEKGIMGRKHRILHLREVMREIKRAGFIYDREYNMFVEDPRVRQTHNWGVLREFEEYIFTFVCFDVVGSSYLVRRHSEDLIQQIYSEISTTIKDITSKRNGRLWNWEGDGGLIAFYFSNKNKNAALSAIEIVHELYIYNLIRNRLDEPLRMRIAVHSGPCQFRHAFTDIKSDTLNQIYEIESSHTKPDSVTFSSTVYRMLDNSIARELRQIKGKENTFYTYKLRWEG